MFEKKIHNSFIFDQKSPKKTFENKIKNAVF